MCRHVYKHAWRMPPSAIALCMACTFDISTIHFDKFDQVDKMFYLHGSVALARQSFDGVSDCCALLCDVLLHLLNKWFIKLIQMRMITMSAMPVQCWGPLPV